MRAGSTAREGITLTQISSAPNARNPRRRRRLRTGVSHEASLVREGGYCRMMMCETELRPSPIHGIGVFLLEPVKAGQLLWRFDSRIDRIYSQGEFSSLPVRMQRFIETYST